ncbi:pathogenesis-related protein 5-like [Neltuma alba]|uniref:pathogenesis-related protein 5-like n=1 Tax=Neltuma alba TaxID=207710 RepID=UPI0010A311A3|nr:pathogenesis-related protein 5-like [Prosopis alba]XP_028800936.1 pathogenesis-related protein 5-like [Prosopis alba]
MAHPYSAFLKLTFIFIVTVSGPELCGSKQTFTFVNYCKETIWPGITHNDNFTSGSFTLKPCQSQAFTAPAGWNGRIWARTGCNFDKNGAGKCRTGGCGTEMNCSAPGSPPSTLAEFALGELDYYDVSLVDGFNLPIAVQTVNGTGNCSSAGCDGDLRQNCPSQLAMKEDGKVIACRSACDVFKTDEYCCRGQHGNPGTCLPSNYSKSFKSVCPVAYSYAYDDPTSVLTCSGADFVVTFCGSRNQTLPTSHDNQHPCNASNAHKAIPQSLWVLMLPLAFMFNSWIAS